MSWLGDLGSAILGALYANAIPVAVAGIGAVIVFGLLARRLGWPSAARRHPGRATVLVVAAIAVALPLGWYLASPLVLSASLDEPAPVSVPRTALRSEAVGPSAVPSPIGASPVAQPRASTAEPVPVAFERTGTFHGSDEFHFGRGTARLIEVSPGAYVVRLEDFAVRNGPDLYVYLSPERDGYAREAIELGRLKADKGNQNYPVPAGAVDGRSSPASVVIWCKQFSHLFATAPLAG